jgi:hypothetical protein
MDINCFPSSFEEGWIRPQFCHLALSYSGDGVVGVITFNHLPQSARWRMGTPPDSGGEIFGSLMKNDF